MGNENLRKRQWRPGASHSPSGTRAVVIGGGPAGLGTAARLAGNGIEVTVLERGEAIASRWRNGYDALRLNTSSLFSYLPGQRFPRRLGKWIGRDDLVAYYREYAASHGLQIHTGIDAERVERVEGGWEVQASQSRFRAEVAVVATGKHHTPMVPGWPGLAGFQGTLLHAAEYRNAVRFRDQRVLVVGVGNSGTDIAVDLAYGGAAEVWISARRPPHLLRRQLMGLPHDVLSVATRRLPERMVDRGALLIRRLTIGDLGEVGLPIPEDGAATRFAAEGRVPTIDSGDFIQAVRGGRISVVAGIERFADGAVILRDRSSVSPDAVVAATGYRSDLESLVGHLGVLDSRGLPTVHGGATHAAAPGLYFVGFRDPRSGHLRELRLQAKQVRCAVSESMPTLS